VAFGKLDDSMKFYREYALKSVWKPIIAFQNNDKKQYLNYKTVNFNLFIRSKKKIFVLLFLLVVIIKIRITSTNKYSNYRTDKSRKKYFNYSFSY
jgi:hypothetical protein